MFTCSTHTLRVLDSSRPAMETTKQRGYWPCQAFFLGMQGRFGQLPVRIGLKKTHLAMVLGRGVIRAPLRIHEGGNTPIEPRHPERYATREAEISERQRVETKRKPTAAVYGSRVRAVSPGKERGSTFYMYSTTKPSGRTP